MSKPLRTKTPTFRFNRNEDDLLEEVLESNDTFNEVKDESSLDLMNESISSVDTSVADLNASHLSGSGVSRERPTVKDFITARLNKTKSLDEESGRETGITSNWFNDIKGKIKEKIDERKREKELRQTSGATDPMDTKTYETDSQTKDPLIKNIINDTIDESNGHKINELSVDYADESFVSAMDYSLAQNQIPEQIDSKPKISESIVSNESNEDIDFNLQPDIEESQQLWSYSQIFNITALIIALISLVISLSLPVHSFISGLLFGSVLTLVVFSVIFVYIISNYMVVKTPIRRDSAKRDVPIVDVPKDEEIQKGWVYELVGNYEERDSGFKVQLIYLRLQDSNLRLSKPKHMIKKNKLNSNSLPVFISQRFFDLSKISHKKVYLLLPKSVRNQKKYVFSKKYPICLELEDIKTKSITKLILFIRNCREKEEWFWKLRQKIQQNLYPSVSMGALSPPPTPVEASDVMTAEIESLPRSHSLDLGSIQSATTCSSNSNSPTSPSKELLILSKQLDYNLFMDKLMAFKSSSDDTSSLSWFNALIGRICYDILNEQFWSTYIAAKIQRKLRRLRLPYFMESLTITEIDVGNTLPKFNSIPNPPLVDKRGLWIDFDITYSGGFTMTLETKLNLMKLKEQANGSQEMKSFAERSELDLSDNESDSIMTSSDEEMEDKPPVDPEDADTTKKQQKILKFVDKIASSQYFQKVAENKYVKRAMEGVSKTALILTVQIQTLNGTLAINIPEPPTDRLWYGFRGNPDLVLSARPKLGEHEVSISHVTDIIERKLRAEFAKVLVMPNMDDLVLPVLMANIDQFITVVP
ncbi:unnamed protein product [Oppiella nova]|uniref:SMP-LTD domain-containing protein n=1 Tax=Oppiella nova TaxID=334625 RepID=A0A7R9LEG8_9ACAR|nr:unnamed protein product [Oppiella nova]CAG2162011.1 unnamed protein product [Oppiella nova]